MKHDWEGLQRLWMTSGVSKKEFAAQRGLTYPTLITKFKAIELRESAKSQPTKPQTLDREAFSKIQIATSPIFESPKIVITTSNGTRLEVPI